MTELRRPWGTITAAMAGRGEAIVLLHPLALSGEFWAPVAQALSSQFQVITIDARGHGSSRWDGTPFSISDLAEDAAAVCDELGLSRVRVMGMSMGGCVALTLAGCRPDLVHGLVLADTTADYGPDKAAKWAARAGTAVGKPRHAQLAFQVERWFSPEFVSQEPAEVQRVCDIFVGTDSSAHAQACRALGSFNGTERLARIKCPTLILVGEQDEATPPSMAHALNDGITSTELEILPGVRHFAVLEVPQRWPTLFGRLLPAG